MRKDLSAELGAILSLPRLRSPARILDRARDETLEDELRTAGTEIVLRICAYLSFGPPADPGASTRGFDPEAE